MGRWEPNARERLVRAALDLFAEQGYDATTVAEIAERAGGLTKTTFFRHFADKREVLFVGQDEHRRLLAEGIAAAPEGATALQAVAGGLDALGASFTEERRQFAAKLLAVIAANAELRERATFKRASLIEAMAGALRARGVPELTAGLAAELGGRAFSAAFDRWSDPAAAQSLPDLARRMLQKLQAAASELGREPVSEPAAARP